MIADNERDLRTDQKEFQKFFRHNPVSFDDYDVSLKRHDLFVDAVVIDHLHQFGFVPRILQHLDYEFRAIV